MPPTLESTIAFISRCHAGQVDKAGAPYVLHPLRVMLSLGALATLEEQQSALLHDVVEDCGVSLDELRELGYSAAVVHAVDCLTKRPEEKGDYMAAIKRLASNSLARKVKLADLKDNMDLERLPSPTPRDMERLRRYNKARLYLERYPGDRE